MGSPGGRAKDYWIGMGIAIGAGMGMILGMMAGNMASVSIADSGSPSG
jgi:hypothetical protein